MYSTNPLQVLLIIAAVFTIGGGLSAVIWTDAVQVLHSTVLPCLALFWPMQTALMVAGAAVLSVFSLQAVGGYSGLVDGYSQAQAH